MNYFNMSDAQLTGFMQDPRVQVILFIFTIWDLVWRGIALWKATKNDSKPWFVALLVLNTLGVLPIIYIFFFSKKKEK